MPRHTGTETPAVRPKGELPDHRLRTMDRFPPYEPYELYQPYELESVELSITGTLFYRYTSMVILLSMLGMMSACELTHSMGLSLLYPSLSRAHALYTR